MHPATRKFLVRIFWLVCFWTPLSVIAQFDTTPPVTFHSLSGTLGNNGWYRSAVTVTLSASDSGSGVAATYYRINGSAWTTYSGAFTVSVQGASTVDYYSIDWMGNNESPKTVQIKIDTVAPASTASASGTLGNNGWYRTSVSVFLSSSDATSGVANRYYRLNGGSWTTYTGAFTVSSQGSNLVEYYATDSAGNVESAKSLSIKIDTVNPSSAYALSGTLGNNGWFRSSVTVALSASDGASGVASTLYRINGGSWATYSGSFTISGQGTSTVEYYSTDNAGNSESIKSVDVKIDTTPPISSSSLSGTLGSNGWYRSSVSVAISSTDAISGVASRVYRVNGGSWSTYVGPFTIAAQGTTTVEFQSSDSAGNWESVKSVTIKIDSTGPSSTSTVTGTLGSNGWYRSAVSVSVSASDAASGVASTGYRVNGGAWLNYVGTFNVSSQGTSTVDYYATDQAGNSGPTNSTQIKIDTNPPTSSHGITGQTNSAGWYESQAVVTISASDATSGIASRFYMLDGGTTNQYAGPIHINTSGNHELRYWSADMAGNVESARAVHLTVWQPFAVTGSLSASGATMQIRWTGPVGSTYDIQSSHDLISWTTLDQVTLVSTDGSFEDPVDPSGSAERFYRLVLVSY
jgi:large repetitive protein